MHSVFLQQACLPSGWATDVRLTIEAGCFASVEPGVTPEPNEPQHAIGVPGIPNLHSHAFQRAMAGLTETRGPGADSFWTWREVMYALLARLTPDDVEAVTAFAFMEMLESGFTRVGEFHYLHHTPDGSPYADLAEMAVRIAAAAAATGIGLTLLPVFYAQGGFGAQPPAPGQRRFVTTLDAYAALLEASERVIAGLPGANLGVAPHSLRAVTPEHLAVLTTMRPDAPLHMHIAEQEAEVEACVAWSGAKPVQWLLDHAPVDARWCLIHATHMDAAEATRLAGTGTVAGLCPLTEANLGDGIFPGSAWLAASGRYGIGSDSNVLIDAAQELRMLELSQRLARRARNVMTDCGSTGATLLSAAVAGGAQALGVPAGLAPGASADWVTLRPDHPALLSRRGDHCLDGWIFAGDRGVIDGVWVRGQPVVADGAHRDRARIAARYAAALSGLLA